MQVTKTRHLDGSPCFERKELLKDPLLPFTGEKIFIHTVYSLIGQSLLVGLVDILQRLQKMGQFLI